MPSRRASGRQARRASRALSVSAAIAGERPYTPWIVAHPEVTPDDVLQQSYRLAFHQSLHHVGKYSSNSVKALIRLADVLQPKIIEKNLLNNEDGDSFGELGPGLHYPQAKWDYFS